MNYTPTKELLLASIIGYITAIPAPLIIMFTTDDVAAALSTYILLATINTYGLHTK